jgi:hypothetical protein
MFAGWRARQGSNLQPPDSKSVFEPVGRAALLRLRLRLSAIWLLRLWLETRHRHLDWTWLGLGLLVKGEAAAPNRTRKTPAELVHRGSVPRVQIEGGHPLADDPNTARAMLLLQRCRLVNWRAGRSPTPILPQRSRRSASCRIADISIRGSRLPLCAISRQVCFDVTPTRHFAHQWIGPAG